MLDLMALPSTSYRQRCGYPNQTSRIMVEYPAFCNMDAGMEGNLVYPFECWFNMNAYWQGEHNLDDIISRLSLAHHKKLSEGVFGSFLRFDIFKMVSIVLSEEEKRLVELNVAEAGPVVPIVAFKYLTGKEVVEESEDTCDESEDGGVETNDGGAENEDDGAETEDDDHEGQDTGDDRQDAPHSVELDQDLVNAIVKKVNKKFQKRLRSHQRRLREYIRGVDNKVDSVLDFMKKWTKNFEENEGCWRKDVSRRRDKEQSGSFRNSLNLYSCGGNASVGRRRKSPPDALYHSIWKSKSPSYERQEASKGSVVRKSKSCSDVRKEVSGSGAGLNSNRQLHGAS